ncbi:DUF4349 domain-containing protein [Nonomuraea diastatica]|uniref:DUF4349 domain-containing protein n=1 Tax=Nonomuraea diastatica TaxID=1848329 RepID=A0A4R4WPL5_9ACTN|nr:DUF4349 domain-containing protein [Nonomuraea diastatica]TDD16280.1 DUF4349 domain-containing protein [Nonomuraea diastatica]
MRRMRYGIALSAACLVTLLGGCGGGSLSAGAPAMDSTQVRPERYKASQPQARAQSTEQSRPQADGGSGDGGDSVVSGVKVTRQERQVIYTGSMTVRAERVSTAVQQAKQIVTAAGGHLSKEETNSADATEDSAMLEFKIPPAKYAEVAGRLGKDLGRQLSMNQGTQDVTLQVADVESRLKSAQQSLESLRTLLKKAETIGQVLQVEREISDREADLESLQAQQKELAAQVAMATLTLRLVGPVATVAGPDEEPAGFLGGLEAGWGALVSFVKVALTMLGAVLPWVVVSLPLLALVIHLVRRDRAARGLVAAPPPGPKPGGPGPTAA